MYQVTSPARPRKMMPAGHPRCAKANGSGAYAAGAGNPVRRRGDAFQMDQTTQAGQSQEEDACRLSQMCKGER